MNKNHRTLIAVFASVVLWPCALSAETWTLERYLAEIFAASHDLVKAQENTEIYKNEYIYQLADFILPAVNVNASNTPYSVHNDPKWEFRKHNADAGVTASLNLYNNFKDKTDIDSARLNRKYYDGVLWQERQRLTIEALKTYYDVLRKKRLLAVVATSRGSYEEQYEKTRRYYKEGLKSYSDVLKSELNLRSSQLQEVRTAESYRNAVMDLDISLYRSPQTEVELVDVSSITSVAGPAFDQDLAYALINRVEMKLAGLELDKRRLEFRKTKLNILPDISADAYYSRDGIGSWGRPSSGAVNPVYYFKLSLSLPIGPRTFADRKDYISSEIGVKRQERAVYELRLNVERELLSQALALETALKTYEVSKMKADISRQNLEIVKNKYGTGQAGIIELGEAQRDDLGSQSELANALYDLLLARAYYDKAAGRQLWR